MKRRCRIQIAGGMQTSDKCSVARDPLERRAAHARHEAHVQHDIGAVGDLNAAAREWRVDRAHAVGHHIQRAALHAAGEQGIHLRVSLLRCYPMVVGTCVFLIRRANEGEMFNPSHVRGMRARQHAVGKALRIERQQLLVRNQLTLQGFEFRLAAVAPMDFRRLREFGDFIDPGRDVMIHRGEGYVLRCCGHWLSLEESLIDR